MKKKHKINKILLLLSILFILFLVSYSCAKKVDSNPKLSEINLSSDRTVSDSPSIKQEYQNSTNSTYIDFSNNPENYKDETQKDAYLVYTANIRGKVISINEFEKQLVKLINKDNGYISLVEKFNEDEITIIFKIPKGKFYSNLDSIKNLFISLENERVQIEDISTQYIDVEARLLTKKEAEKRYLALMQKANSVKDILEIEQALRQIREEIESFEANLRYLKNSVQYSTITITAYSQSIKIQGENFLTRFIKSISNGFNFLVSAFLFIISLWPLFILFILILIIYKIIKRKREKKDAK